VNVSGTSRPARGTPAGEMRGDGSLNPFGAASTDGVEGALQMIGG
jgi:hypothetical protein